MPQGLSEIIEEAISIEHRGSTLSSVMAYPIAGTPRGAALIAGPHPLMGGGLQNNIVLAVARGMAEHGFVSLRFAYGGEGTSRESMQEFWRTGCAPEDPARVDEATAALRQLQGVCAGPLMFIGYSFGASVLGALLLDSTADRVVLIGPTLRQHSFDDLQRSSVAKLIITANNDFATPLDVTRAWFERARAPKKLVIITSAEHFYRGLEDRLTAEIVAWI